MMVRSRSYIATPPGATIKEQLEDRDMSQKEFAARMDLSEKHVSRLLNGKVELTPDVARRLEMVLGIPASFWNKLEAIYREKLVKIKDENEMEEDKGISKNFPYSDMAKHGWVSKSTKPEEKVVSLRKFFEVAKLSLIAPMLLDRIACRKLGNTDKSKYALMAWIQQAKREARRRKTASINVEGLKASVPKIRKMTNMDATAFSSKLIDLLADYGISLVYLPHLKDSYLQGATFYDGKKYVIGLTARNKYADIFWFSLFHELGHIILGHVGKPGGTSEEDEHEADFFAENSLIPQEPLKRFIQKEDYSKTAILEFAKDVGVDAGIVTGRLQKEHVIQYSEYLELKKKYVIA